MSGMSSGEDLIWNVRDAQEKDPGIADKRLFVVETEFSQALKSMSREGNCLSSVIRQSFDDGILRTLTKNNPAVATGAHVSIIAYITLEELRRLMSETDALNGFANRFLWCCVRRSKLLPEGG